MSYIFLFLALFCSFIDLYAAAKELKRLEYVTRPLVMVLLLIYLVMEGGITFPLLWFTLGVLFSLIGDILLMLPGEKLIPGLLAFLIAHIFYVIGLTTSPVSLTFASLIIVLLVSIVSWRIYKAVSINIPATQKGLRIAMMIYTLVISMMLVAALFTLVRTDEEWHIIPTFLVSAGAMLFYVSDFILAWNRFVKPVKHASVWNLSTYHLGQILIVLGAVLNF